MGPAHGLPWVPGYGEPLEDFEETGIGRAMPWKE